METPLLSVALRLLLGLLGGWVAHGALVFEIRQRVRDYPHRELLITKLGPPMQASLLILGAWLATIGLDAMGLRLSLFRIALAVAGLFWIQGALGAIDVLRAEERD